MPRRPASRRMHLGAVALVALAVVSTLAAAQVANADASRWEKAIAAFEAWDARNTPAPQPVLFIGSSSIRMWPTGRHFADLPVVNRGFGGSQISDVNAFAERIVSPYAPRIIVFYCGDNDIKAGKTPERVVDDYRAFVAFVRKTSPETRIVYLPIKPSISRWSLWKPMEAVNAAIRVDIEKDPRQFYADVATPMLPADGGMPAADLFIQDGLHLSEKGYALWVKTLRPVLDQALTPR